MAKECDESLEKMRWNKSQSNRHFDIISIYFLKKKTVEKIELCFNSNVAGIAIFEPLELTLIVHCTQTPNTHILDSMYE